MIGIHSKKFVLSDSDKEKIEIKAKKLIHLCKDMMDESTHIRVEFELIAPRKNLIKGTLTIALHGCILRAEKEMEKSVISIMDELEKEIRPQIEKHKNKDKN